MNRYIRYILPAIFLSSIFLIVFLQFNSNEAIHELMDGNTDLQNVYKVKGDFQHLISNILALEAKVKTVVIKGERADSKEFDPEKKNILQFSSALDTLSNNTDLNGPVNELKALVDAKMSYNDSILLMLNNNGKKAAEELVNNNTGKNLTDSIREKSAAISKLYETNAEKIITEASADGNRAKAYGLLIAFIAAIACIFVFVYISFKIREQQGLIERLNISENNARNLAKIKDRFLANMSHEIRTPLNAIIGFTHLLQRKKLDGMSAEYVNNIHTSGENLLSVVNDILDLSKIEEGLLRIETEPFEISKVLENIRKMFSEKINRAGIVFRVVIDPSLPQWLQGDSHRLNQILINLVGNAVKFTQTGAIELVARLNRVDGNKVQVLFKVSDTGIGISESELEKIFERFHQADEAITRKYGGTGLGLSIVKSLIEQQGGHIEAASQSGKGTTFTFDIWYEILNTEKKIKEITDTGSFPQNISSSKKILVVEDNKMNLSLLSHLLNLHHFDFIACENGNEAIRLLETTSFDLVLMDVQMPVMDGYTAARYIREVLKISTPIIAMTAHAMEGDEQKCIDAGMDGYLPKPINELLLLQLIKKHLHYESEAAEKGVFNITINGCKYINLSYLKEISMGDLAYEKMMVQLFIDEMPAAVAKLKQEWATKDIEAFRDTAHDLKNTVSVMGLTNLMSILHKREHDPVDADLFTNYINELNQYGQEAVKEANIYLKHSN